MLQGTYLQTKCDELLMKNSGNYMVFQFMFCTGNVTKVIGKKEGQKKLDRNDKELVEMADETTDIDETISTDDTSTDDTTSATALHSMHASIVFAISIELKLVNK